jgi:hypothetical protein
LLERYWDVLLKDGNTLRELCCWTHLLLWEHFRIQWEISSIYVNHLTWSLFFFFGDGTGVYTQNLTLRQSITWATISALFLLGVFEIGSCFLPSWLWNSVLLFSASWVAMITGKSHCCPATWSLNTIKRWTEQGVWGITYHWLYDKKFYIHKCIAKSQ